VRTLKDRVAVVTGAASGIGRATSVALAREGCHVAISDVDEAGLAATAAEIRALDRRVSTHRVDVSDRERVRVWADEVAKEHGAVHVLVNNAGVTVTASFAEHTWKDWEWIVGVNFWGVVHGCTFFLPHLRAAGEGHIVNLSSLFGLIGVPLQSSYCATKFAVRGLSEALWIELRDENIGVTSVHPGGIRTSIAASARGANESAKSASAVFIGAARVSPDDCARDIVRAIKRNRMRQLVARETYVIETLKRMAPEGVTRMTHRGFRRWRKQVGA
jgi:short-subunit dehydrogenase